MKIVVILLALFMSGKGAADVYRVTDTDGRVYYTDKPRNSFYKRIIKTKAWTTYTHTTTARQGAHLYRHQQEARRKAVKAANLVVVKPAL